MADDLGDLIIASVESVSAKYAKQRKAEERHASAELHRRDAMTRVRRVTLREAAFAVMEAAYPKASDYGTLYANARQVMYAARPDILAQTGKDTLDTAYFTQQLLPDYIAEHMLEGVWKIAYDARGHFTEPHRPRLSSEVTRIALGTAEVRGYAGQPPPGNLLEISGLALDFPTAGPEHRYSGAVFIEKEGFDQQIAQSGLADKHDVAFMSTKGMSTTAARELIDYLAGEDVPVFVVHDFDRAGFTIAGTLGTDSRRYEFAYTPDVTDLGLRIDDVQEYGLASEPWQEKGSQASVIRTLDRHGATAGEIDFLVEGGNWSHSYGQRVELNAFTTVQFIEWLDGKLGEHVPGKVVPDGDTLATAYRRARIRIAVNKKIAEVQKSIRDEATAEPVPDDLEGQVREKLEDEPGLSWDEALAGIALGDDEPAG
jgi:Protein of unknown function C-terminus (DUF2399)